mgnify:CR=1 FL=1|jgi:hypothetical protein
MTKIESLMRLRAATHNGWAKTNKPSDYRVIRIGNALNCNDDSIICDLKLKKNIEDVLNQYEINNNEYILDEIKTRYEYSYELKINESAYKNLIGKIS